MQDSGSTKLIVPAMGGLYAAGANLAYPIIRIVAGLWLIPHGYVKLFGGGWAGTVGFFGKLGLEPANVFVGLSGGAEFFGGILIALGLLTRVAAAAAAIDLLCATFLVHWAKGFFAQAGGWEFPLMWAILCIVIFLRGGGKFSVDRALGKEF